MKIDTAIQVFSEKYDREAMQYIDEISRERGLVLTRSKLKAFNINESFNDFSQYLKEYAEYKVKNKNNEQASPQDTIRESVRNFIKTQMFKESDLLYSDIPQFIESYINGIETLREAVDSAKDIMMEGDIDYDAIADVNDFTDNFMDSLHESFDPLMDKILMASGYVTSKVLMNPKKSAKKPIFL